MQYANQLIKDNMFDKAANVMSKYGITNDMNTIAICRATIIGILNKTFSEEESIPSAYVECKKFL